MHNRRDFLKNSGTFALGSLLLPQARGFEGLPKKLHPIGLQLYTLSSIIENDLPGTLKKVAAIGYQEIESAFGRKSGYYGVRPKEFAAMIKDHGMSWKSHHVGGAPFKMRPNANPPMDANGKPIVFAPRPNLRENMQQLVDDAAEGGLEYLVCASTPIETLDEIKQSIETLNKAAEAAKKTGVTIAYHNHDREFKAVEGKIPYDLLLSETDPSIKMELDLCWVTKAGVDPVTLFKKNPGRFHLWHVKDIDKDFKGPLPVGTGIVNFNRIFDHAKESGMKHFFVEHDNPADPYGSITTSYNNLKKMKIK